MIQPYAHSNDRVVQKANTKQKRTGAVQVTPSIKGAYSSSEPLVAFPCASPAACLSANIRTGGEEDEAAAAGKCVTKWPRWFENCDVILFILVVKASSVRICCIACVDPRLVLRPAIVFLIAVTSADGKDTGRDAAGVATSKLNTWPGLTPAGTATS